MKRKLLFITLSLISYIASAQFEVRAKSDNSVITDGQVINFNESGCGFTGDCNWKFEVENTSAQDIYMRIFVDNLTGTDGSNFQLCFAGVCLNSVALNSGYPSTAALISSGGINSAGNNFWNQNPANTPTAMSWTFRFQAFDSGDNPIGTPLSMTYNYDQNLSIGNNTLDTLRIFPTNVKNELNIVSQQSISAEFFNLLGQRVKSVTLKSGNAVINLSELRSQAYIIRFTDQNGKQIVKKIIKE